MTTSPACTDSTKGRFFLAVALAAAVTPDGIFTPPMPMPPCISTSVLSVVRLVVNGLHLHTIHGQGMDAEGRAKSLNLNGHGLFAADGGDCVSVKDDKSPRCSSEADCVVMFGHGPPLSSWV